MSLYNKVKKSMKKTRLENALVLIFVSLFLFSIIMIMNQKIKTTGYATETSTTSNVTISTYFAIELSANLSNGIEFGTVSTLPATNQNATDNHNGANTTQNGTGASMWVNVSTDSNSALDFCVKADAALQTSGGASIGVGNESYHNSTQTNVSLPDYNNEVAYTTSYVKAGFNTSIGGRNFYRFWLDVPAATTAGNYNNTVSFKGVATGGSC